MYELRHAWATLLMERGLPPYVVASQLGRTDDGALVQRLHGHPEEARTRDQIRLAFAPRDADGAQPRNRALLIDGFRSESFTPSLNG